jgi:hypothetical protein
MVEIKDTNITRKQRMTPRKTIMSSKLATLKKYSNPTRVLKLAKQYYNQHPFCIGSKSASMKPKLIDTSLLIGTLDKKTGASLYISTRKNKKYALFNGNKTTHFGQLPYEDFTKHKNTTRRRNYLQRSTHIKGDWKRDPYSANNLAIHLLW